MDDKFLTYAEAINFLKLSRTTIIQQWSPFLSFTHQTERRSNEILQKMRNARHQAGFVFRC